MSLLSTISLLDSGQTVYYGTATPGVHDIFSPAKVGDIVINTAPANGQPAGWTCTVGGTQASPIGTWIAFYAGLSVPSVSNLLSGDGAGAIADSGITVASAIEEVATLTLSANASIVTQAFFGRAAGAYTILAAYEIHGTAGTDSGSVTIDITADTAGTAPGGGTSILSAPFNAKGTANTWQTGTLAVTSLPAGSRLSIKVTGTTTALANVLVTVVLKKA